MVLSSFLLASMRCLRFKISFTQDNFIASGSLTKTIIGSGGATLVQPFGKKPIHKCLINSSYKGVIVGFFWLFHLKCGNLSTQSGRCNFL